MSNVATEIKELNLEKLEIKKMYEEGEITQERMIKLFKEINEELLDLLKKI